MPTVTYNLLQAQQGREEDMARRRYQRPSVTRSKTRRQYWMIRYRDYGAGGQDKVKVLGWCDELGKRAAEKIRDAFIEPHNHTPAAIQSQTPLAQFVRTYQEVHVSTVRPMTQRQTTSELKHHILPAFGPRRLCDIDREDVQRWANGLDLAKGSKLNLVRRLHHIYEEADRLGYYSGRNPATKIRIAGETADREVITTDQYQDLLAAIDDPWRLAVRIAAETGLRIGEIRGLKRGDLDFEAGLIHVKRQINQASKECAPKTAKSTRDVPMGELLAPLKGLARWHKGLLFPVRHYSGISLRLRRAAVKAGITARGFGWHTLRALYATVAHETGADALDIRDSMGHARMETTGRYALGSQERQASVTKRVQERLGRKTG